MTEFILPKATQSRKTTIGQRSKDKYLTACGALLADLFDLQEYASDGVSREGYHGLSKSNFSKELLGFGYDAFMDVMMALEEHRVINVTLGDKTPTKRLEGRRRRQTLFSLTPLGQQLASQAGLHVGRFPDHWKRYNAQTLPQGHHNIHLKEAATYRGDKRLQGKPMDFTLEDHPSALAAAGSLETINTYLRQQSFGDIAFPGLRRIFNNGNEPAYAWNKGGRFYSIAGGHRYEAWSARKRQHVLCINGEATAEVDLKASHLTLLYALMEQPFDASSDPYEVHDFPRGLVKIWVTRSLGLSKGYHVEWSGDLEADYEHERPDSILEFDYPHDDVQGAILYKHPILLDIDKTIHSPLHLQFHEAEILRRTMEDLMLVKDIPVLPIHDALICPKSLQEEVKASLLQNFKAYVEDLTNRPCAVSPMVAFKTA